jgi:DNA-binding transcriptional regulator PaaX
MKAFRKPRPVETQIAETILGTLVIGTTILFSPVAGAAAFGASVATGGYLFRKRDFNREIKRLEKRGFIALTKTPKGYLVKILEKGRRGYQKTQLRDLKLLREKWDGKWRLFIFDIPEDQKADRDYLRKKLKNLGMYNIQRSVFAYPYDCRKELSFVADYYKVEKYTTYAEVSRIDIDKELKHHFKTNKVL